MTGKQAIELYEKLLQIRKPHEWLMEQIGFLTNSRYLDGKTHTETQGNIPHSEIYDTTLRTKSRMQANGITSMLFPRDRDWLELKPPWELRNNRAAQKVYREAGEGIMHYLRESNFHHQNHGVILNRSQMGTGTMVMEWDKDDDGVDKMNFRRFEPMSYVIDHDSHKKVTTFACCYRWPASMAASEWGIENLSPKLQKEAKKVDKRDTLHDFIFMIQKRPKWEVDPSKGSRGMLYRVMAVEKDKEHVILDSGNDMFPVISSRYEVQDSPWGYSPAWEILPDAYKANYAAKFMMVMGERAAVPPVIAPASMKEEGIGLGAAEVTYVSDLNPNSAPYELASKGNYQVGMDIWQNFKDSIDQAFHGDLFNMFSRQTKERTATEITAMIGELNSQVDPTITALTQDHTNPIVNMASRSLVEKKKITIPDEYLDQGTGRPKMPTFSYDNAISMNHERSKALEAMGLIDFMINAKLQGAEVDVIKMKEVATRIWRGHGQDEDDLLSEEDYQQNQEAQAQAAQQANMIEMAQGGASAAKDFAQAQTA